MMPKWHILFGFVFSYILVYFFNFSLVSGGIIFIASFLLIDLDHYFRYIFITKNYNFFAFMQWSKEREIKWKTFSKEQKEQYKLPIFIFHGIEALGILVILSIFSNIFYFIILGFLIHLAADYIDIFYKKDPIRIKTSQIWTSIKNKNKKSFSL
jgi:hypothetical protein